MSSQRAARVTTVVIGLILVATGTSAAAVSGPDGPSGSLNLGATLTLNSKIGECAPPPGMDECAVRTFWGAFPGLGAVSGRYEFYIDHGGPVCSEITGRAAGYTIRLPVAGKGEIAVAVAEGPCVDINSIRTQSQAFTVIDGTGSYVGASGSGTVERALGEETDTGRHGQERWKGTLSVPGLEFDTSAPSLSGVAARTVKAKRGAKSARVAFAVTARDETDPSVPVGCTPRSGSRFSLGRTRVICTAVDTSANTASASFTITVKKGR